MPRIKKVIDKQTETETVPSEVPSPSTVVKKVKKTNKKTEIKKSPKNDSQQKNQLSSQAENEKIETAAEPSIKEKRGYFFGVGRRKTATARARLYLPNQNVVVGGHKLERGEIYVNQTPIDKYFSDPLSKATYSEIYRTTNTLNRFITTVITTGSGKSGQLGATVLAISRALTSVDPKFKAILRKRGFMTRDPRMKERKKPGLMGARKQKSSPKR